MKQADKHAAKASQYHLNLSSGLLKAQDLKAKENILKQQCKAEMVTIEAQLFMFAVGSATTKKVKLCFYSR